MIEESQMKPDRCLLTKFQHSQYVLSCPLDQPEPQFFNERPDIFAGQVVLTGISPAKHVDYLYLSGRDLELSDLAPVGPDSYHNNSIIFHNFSDANDSFFDKVNSTNYEYLRVLYYNKGNDL